MTQTAAAIDARVPLMIGAIGHRDLVADETDLLEDRVRSFFETLQRKYPDLRVSLLTSVADGADRLVAAVAVSLGMPISYVLPMPSEIFEHDFDAASLREYRQILSGSNVLTLPLVGENTPVDVTHPGVARDLQYAQLGAFIAAHCHILLALWDGNEEGPSGGTAAIVRFHQDDFMLGLTDGEPRSRLDDTDDESDLVYQVVCSRDRPNGSPMAPLKPGEVWWLSRDHRLPRTAEMPSRYEVVLHRMVEFSQDVVRYSHRIDRSPNVLLPPETDAEVEIGARAIAQWFRVADWLSVHYLRRTVNALRLLYGFAGLGSLCFIAYGDLPGQDLLIYPYLVFMAASIGVYLVQRRCAWHRRYVDYRVLAEALRVQFYWAVAGVRRPAASRFGHDAFLKREDLEVSWIRNLLRIAGQRDDASGARSSETGIVIAVRDWIEDESRGQLHYFRRRWPRLLRLHRLAGWFGTLSYAAGLALATWLAARQFWFERPPTNLLIVMVGMLPVVATLWQYYARQRAQGELINQFQFMERILANAQQQLSRATTAAERRRILGELGDAALWENGQWILRQRERPISTVS
jgi:hypothetical protein